MNNNEDPRGRERPAENAASGKWEGREVGRLDCGAFYAIKLQPVMEGQVLALQQRDRDVDYLSLWDYRQDRIVWSTRLAEETAFHAAFANNTRLLGMSSSDPPTVSLYELPSQKVIRHFRGHHDEVTDLAVHPDGRRFLTAGKDANCIVWDMQAPADEDGIVGVFEGHTAIGPKGEAISVALLVVSPDGLRAASCDDFGNVLIWEIDEQIEIARVPARYTGRALGGVIPFWEFEGKLPSSELPQTIRVESLCFLPDSRHLAIGTEGGITLIDGQTGWRLWSYKETDHLSDGSDAPCRCDMDIAVSPDGRLLACGTTRHPVRIVDARDGRIAGSLPGHRYSPPHLTETFPIGNVRTVCFTPDGGHLLTVGQDGTIRLWELQISTGQR